MNDALNHFKKLDTTGKWKEKIEKHQEKVYSETKRKRQTKENLLVSAEHYDIVCAQCKELVTPANRIVKIFETNHHLLTGDAEDVVIRSELSDEKNDHGEQVKRLNG